MTNSFSSCVPKKVFISASFTQGIFAGYRILGCPVFLLFFCLCVFFFLCFPFSTPTRESFCLSFQKRSPFQLLICVCSPPTPSLHYPLLEPRPPHWFLAFVLLFCFDPSRPATSMMILKWQSDLVAPLLKTLYWFPISFRMKPTLFTGPSRFLVPASLSIIIFGYLLTLLLCSLRNCLATTQ